MWKKGVAAAFAVVLLIVGITLLQGVSSTHVDPSAPIVAKPVERLAAPPPTTIATAPVAAPVVHDREPATSGPAAGVWKVMAKPHANPAEEREELVAAFRAAPSCLEKWCDEGRTTLAGWQAAIAAKVPGLTVDEAECSAAGCWMKVAIADPRKWRDVTAALPDVTGTHNWPGPSIQGGPDFQTKRGSVVALWAILPDATDNSEQGED
jgi:hypothetical protein